MPRSGHRKSRKGCLECKKRHVKCDETRPICTRCTSSKRVCAYESLQLVHPSLAARLVDRSIPAHSAEAESPQDILTSSASQYINVTHLKLFHNFEHSTCQTVGRNTQQVKIYCRTVINRAFAVPHILHALLGLSALHLASQDPQVYTHLAAEFQTQALTYFNRSSLANIDESNVLDLLLFQHLIALHVFCDIFTTLHDFNDFMDRLVGCVRLLNGINSVIQPWWHILAQTELGDILQSSDDHQHTPYESRHECAELDQMIDNADLSLRSIEVCKIATARLQSCLDAENGLDADVAASTNMLFSWLITASEEYTEMLEQRKPEALVILAYYAVLLHQRRQSWAVKDSGGKLLRHVRAYLGKKWEGRLAWPVSVVLTDETTEPCVSG